MRRANEVTFSRPISGLWPKESGGLSVWPRFPFFTSGYLSSPGSASKKSISDKALALFSEGMDWSAVWISLFIYCVGFFLSLLLPFFFLTFVCVSAHRRGSWSVERPVGVGTSECRVGWVGEEVSHQGLCRCWRWPFVVSVTHPWGVFFSGGKKIGFRDKRSGSHSGSVTFWECSF